MSELRAMYDHAVTWPLAQVNVPRYLIS